MLVCIAYSHPRIRSSGQSQPDQRAPRPYHDFAPDRCLQLEGRRAHLRLVRHMVKRVLREQDDRRHRTAAAAEVRRDTNERDGTAEPIARRVTRHDPPRHDPPYIPYARPQCDGPRRCLCGCLRAMAVTTLWRCRGVRHRGAAPSTLHELNNGDKPDGAAHD